ncbi:MAG: helix-turn-helix domain-containing protein [Methylocella sp.]
MEKTARLGLRVAEAAELLGVSQETVIIWCRSGQLPSMRCGRTWLISPDALRERMLAPPPGWPHGGGRFL